MHRALSSRWLYNALNIVERPTGLELPVFLCPTAVSNIPRSSIPYRLRTVRRVPWTAQRRCLHMAAEAAEAVEASTAPTLASDPQVIVSPPTKAALPRQCRGCGAFSQTSHPNQPGYFDLNRKVVRQYLGADKPTRRSRQEDEIYEDLLKKLDPEALAKQGVDVAALGFGRPVDPRPQAPPKKPLCDRCHYLLHNHTGESIYHPSIESISDTLLESPYKYNHVYHVLDAADFPMSLLPKISQLLDTMPLRSKNRRSRAGRFYHGQKTEMSFIIARADLLAPTKPQVDALFPYLREVLRDALGRTGRDVRLGNLRAVSAKRGWWTKELKEDIWERGGGGWMVGKANVGKSQLFEAVFPKGRMDWNPSKHQITVDMEANLKRETSPLVRKGKSHDRIGPEDMDPANGDTVDEYSLLPPAPPETQYPEMPLVSDLPGTTASPIRIPFGNGRGELIDLPGLNRTGLDQHVKKEHRLSLLMHSRIVPEQVTIKPGQSLLLGGLIRITPREPAPIMLAYAFTPIEPHVCRTDKAMSIQGQKDEINVENIAVPGTGDKTRFAGSFELKWDVTKKRTGPLTRKDAIHLDVERLPYRVVSTDILIEGVGWVEIVAQVRTKDLYRGRSSEQKSHGENAELPEKASGIEQLEALAGHTVQRPSKQEPERGNTELPKKTSGMEQLEALAGLTTRRPSKQEPQRGNTKPPNKLSGMEQLEALAGLTTRRPSKQEPERGNTELPKKTTGTEQLEALADGRQKKEPWAPLTELESEPEPNWPIVDIYSPEGKFIDCRMPMNGWMLNKRKVTAASRRKRPRKSMKGAKKLEKKHRREQEAAGAGTT